MTEVIKNDNPNQVSFGLTITPDNRVISYLIPEGKVETNAAALCTNEQNPDYLPLVGLRVRRFNEEYPYPAIQGYRTGNKVTVVCYMQPEYARPLPPPVRVVCYMQKQTFEYPVLTEHGLKSFAGSNLSFDLGQGVLDALSFDGVTIIGATGPRYTIKSATPNLWESLGYLSYVDSQNWIGQSGNQITTMRLDADFEPGGTHIETKFGLDVVKYFTIDDATGRITVDAYYINPSAITVSNFRVAELFYSEAWDNIAGATAADFSHGYGSIPGNRLIRSTANASPFTELGIYSPVGDHSVNCILDSNYSNDPDVILLGVDGPSGDSYADIAMAWSLGDIAPGEFKRVQFSIIAGTDPAVMYAGLS